MRHIPTLHHSIQSALITAQSKGVTWSNFSTSSQGDALRQAKASEQNGLCAYCECRLTGNDGALLGGVAHIDHFHRRSEHPELTFNWDNLFLSCKKSSQCGIHKDNKKMHTEDIIHPHHEQPQEYITFISDSAFGVYTRALPNGNRTRADYTITAFNLNTPELVALRHHALAACRVQIDILTTDIECAFEMELSEELTDLLSEARKLLHSFSSLPFASTILAYANERWRHYIDIS